jgi:hypothetical protein
MVYNTENYWVFRLFPSTGILETRKQDVSETGSVSVLKWREEKTPTHLGPLERANLNHSICVHETVKQNPPSNKKDILLDLENSEALTYFTYKLTVSLPYFVFHGKNNEFL